MYVDFSLTFRLSFVSDSDSNSQFISFQVKEKRICSIFIVIASISQSVLPIYIKVRVSYKEEERQSFSKSEVQRKALYYFFQRKFQKKSVVARYDSMLYSYKEWLVNESTAEKVSPKVLRSADTHIHTKSPIYSCTPCVSYAWESPDLSSEK
jgi:hypothetical protein